MIDYANTLLEKGGYANLTSEERVEVDAAALIELRKIRNGLLKETDKYSASDFPLSDSDRMAIMQYRQELRDLTIGQSPLFQEDGGAMLRGVDFPSSPFVPDEVFYKYAPISVTA